MKVAGIDGNTLVLYGALGVGAYLFVTKLLPDLIERLGKSAGDTAAAAAKGLAQGAGKTGASLIMAAPRALDAGLEELGLPSQSLEKLGSNIGTSLYDAVHLFAPNPVASSYIVTFPDGARHAVDSTLVDSRGRFKYASRMYQLKDTATGTHVATPL